MARKPDFETGIGNGGETHRRVSRKGPHGADAHLTTDQDIRVSDNRNSLKAGARGPTQLEDFVLREKIFHFDHERIPERIVHARGLAAHGYFELYKSLAGISKADLFQRAGEKTPVFVPISTVAGGAGSVDTPRDVRGFAVKQEQGCATRTRVRCSPYARYRFAFYFLPMSQLPRISPMPGELSRYSPV